MTHKRKKVGRKKRKPTVAKELIDVRCVPLHDFSLKQICEANDIWNQSRYLYHMYQLLENLRSGIVPSKVEQEAIDEFITLYNTLCKSPLAKAMKE